MKKIKTSLLIFSLITSLGAISMLRLPAAKNLLSVKDARAEDEKEDEEKDEEDEKDDDSSKNQSSSKIEYEIIYTKLPDTVVEETKEVPRYDTDMDGMYDDEDPHPAINEFIIVTDEDLNGIDDKYEQQNEISSE